jgi:GGDEF domain-containing protein
MKGGIRNVDHLFRSRADELTILLPETPVDGARIVVERLRHLLQAPDLFSVPEPPRVAVASVSYPKQRAADGNGLWRAAQKALPT